ncbi:MAG: universal stress protein [Bacteroidales bacterium]
MTPVERDTILVPTDFSDVAEFSMDHAAEIAKLFNHKICLLHVVSRNMSSIDNPLHGKLDRVAKDLAQKTGLQVRSMLREGSIFSTISEVADEIRAEFIVMGIHGKKGVQHLVGSYAYKVIVSAHVPVLVVKDLHHHVGYHNIVVPIDFAQDSTQKVKQAVRFARYFDAHVRVFGFLTTKSPARVIRKEALLKEVRDTFDLYQVKVTTHLLIQPGAEWPAALMKYAEEVDADLVMIVAEKGDALMDVFSSNTAERIIDKIDVPVLTVSREQADEGGEEEARSVFKTFLDPMNVINQKK